MIETRPGKGDSADPGDEASGPSSTPFVRKSPPAGGSPPHGLEYAPDDEIDLFQLLEHLWRQRLMVVFTVAASLACAVFYLLLATPLYEVNMQVRPGVTAYGEEGEARRWSIDDIVAWVRQQQYRNLLKNSSSSGGDVPTIKAERQGDASAVTLSLAHPDPEYGREFLQNVFNRWVHHYVEAGHDPQIALARKQLEKDVQGLEDQLEHLESVTLPNLRMDIEERKERIKIQTHAIDLVEERRAANERVLSQMQERMDVTLANTNELTTLRDQLLARSNVQDLTLLLYTNIIQQNIFHVSQLQERIGNLEKTILADRKEERDLQKTIGDIRQEIERIRLQVEVEAEQSKRALQRRIELTRDKMEVLAPVELVSGPLATEHPVAPRKTLVASLALVAGGFLGILLALATGAWQARRQAESAPPPGLREEG